MPGSPVGEAAGREFITLNKFLSRNGIGSSGTLLNRKISAGSVVEVEIVHYIVGAGEVVLEYCLNVSGRKRLGIGIGIILVLSHRIVAVNGNLKMSNAKYCKIDGTEVTDKDLKNLKYMTKLQRLELLTPKITDISFVSEMKDLRSFSVESQNITNLSSINNCQNLQTLNLYHTNLTSLKDLAENSNLRVLDVYTGNPLLNISDLHHLPKLEQLSISSSKLIDISPISELSDLKILELSCCSIKDLSPLGDCVKIQKLNLTGCEQISDLSPITKLDTLEEINLSGTSISDFSVLLSIKGLKKVVADNGQIDPSILSKLKSQNVIVDIV